MGQASEAELRSEARTANKLFFFAFMLVAVGVVAFLLSDEAASITGAQLKLSMGQ